jgi:hypothetical protein
MRSTSFWPLFAVAAIACGRGDNPKVAVTDTTSRDLQLAPADTTSALHDVPAPADTAGAAAPVVDTSTSAPTAKPAPKPAATKPRPATTAAAPAAAPAAKPAPAKTLSAGTKFTATARDSITSTKYKAGDVLTLKVPTDVTNDAGTVVIPAGSSLKARVAEIKWSENKSDKGKLRLEPTSVVIADTPYDVSGNIGNPAFAYKKRGSVAGDIAKPAAGAAAGAVVGGLLGKGTGAVIGGVVGGAVGTQRMVETKDRDIVVPPGGEFSVELTSEFKR